MKKLGYKWKYIDSDPPPVRKLVWLESENESGERTVTLGYRVEHKDPWWPFRNDPAKYTSHYLNAIKEPMNGKLTRWGIVPSPYDIEGIVNALLNQDE